MSTNYEKLCVELFGTNSEKEIRKIVNELKIKKTRNAGRKNQFNHLQIQKMKELHKKGYTTNEIAKIFETTRQTVSRYINIDNLDKAVNDNFILEMDFMNNNDLCTMIFVDYLNQKIKVNNITDDCLYMAFGKNKNPNWQDYEYFLTERCFPESRGDKKRILKLLNVDSYDPFQIIERTKGRMYDDNQWIKIINRRATV